MRKKTRGDEVLIKCPFFRAHSGRAIGCEGITDDCTIMINFHGKAARDQHEEIFCRNRFHYCEIYRAVYQKYEIDDE